MDKTIDCLLIGYNEMKFSDYEGKVKAMGTKSESYRDLNLNFIEHNNNLYTVSGMFNYLFDRGQINNKFNELNLSAETFSATVSYLGTYLYRHGLAFDYVSSFQKEKDTLTEKLKNNSIRTIAITTTFYVSMFPILEIINFIRKNNNEIRIIVGGPFISTSVRTQDDMTLEYIFNSIDADFYINSSQGEKALVNVIKAIKNNDNFEEINNIYYKENGKYKATSTLKENNILEENTVDWSLFTDRLNYFAAIRTAISCPFRCSFCGFPEHAGKYQTISVQAVESELDIMSQIGKVKSIYFIDDTLNVPENRFKDILRMMIKNKYNFKWHSYFRCQFADRETVELMKESGCEGVFLGIESGNQDILNNMNKSANLEKYMKGMELLREYEIITAASFIVGFPGETYETVQDTIDFIEETKPDFYRAQLWFCEPVTPIWREKEKYNIKGSQFKWKHKTMDSKTAANLVEEIFLRVKNSVWVNQYNFDVVGILHLLHRGLSLEQVKKFIKAFNKGIEQKLRNSNNQEISMDIFNEMIDACKIVK